jgi:hypothetical protein
MVRLSPLVHTKYLKNYGISFTCLIGPDIKEITPIVCGQTSVTLD